MRTLAIIAGLVISTSGLLGQNHHIILMDTDQQEFAQASGVEDLRPILNELKADGIGPNGQCYFLTEFGERGDFKSRLVARKGMTDLEALFCSDSLNVPAQGTRPDYSRWLKALAKMASSGVQWEESYSVTLLTFQPLDKALEMNRQFLFQMAVILDRTDDNGEVLGSDNWQIMNPILNEYRYVWTH